MPIKISQLTSISSVDGADVFPLVDDPSGNAVTKKITAANLASSLASVGSLATVSALNAAISQSTSISPSGYLKLKNITIQWGNVTPSAQETSITLPVAWTTGFLSGAVSIGENFTDTSTYADNSAVWGIYPDATTPGTKITIMSNLRTAATTIVYKKMYWIAIGY
jgi:hypothetical protein